MSDVVTEAPKKTRQYAEINADYRASDGTVINGFTRADFVVGKEGKKAYYTYMRDLWNDRIAGLDRPVDPIDKAKRRLAKLQAMIAKLDAQIASGVIPE